MAPRQKLLSSFIDVLIAVSRVAVRVDAVWDKALTDHARACAELILRSSGDMLLIRMHLDALTELLRLLATRDHPRQPLLEAQKAILSLQTLLHPTQQTPTTAKELPRPVPVSSSPIQLPAPASFRLAKSATINKNKEAILSFIRRTPRARTKDIIDGFQALSERTVKRNLKELVRSGLVQRRAEQKAVYYLTIDLN